MSVPSRLKILFSLQVFLGLSSAILSNGDIFKNMSLEERKSFFGTEDGSIPEFEVVELIHPHRSKRATQNPLEITFNYMGIPTSATLTMVEDHELFSPTSTGIWFAEYNPAAHNNVVYTPKPDMFERIGNFNFFQNISDCSAVTKFWTADGHITMSGVLKQDYGVRTVPLRYEEGLFHFSHKRAVKRRSTNSTEDQNENSSLFLVVYKLSEIPLEYFRRRSGTQNSSLPDLDLHRKRRQNVFNPPNIVYPKLLISPDYKVISGEKTVEQSVQQLIAHLNAVDMMYRQVTIPQIRLKIGGIIIPQSEFATPYIAPNTATDTNLQAEDVMVRVKNYFTNEKYRFQYDSYSALIILTMSSIWAYNTQSGTQNECAGYGMIGSACQEGRGIVKYSKGFQGVFLAAHEIGHIFNAEHDDGVKSPCLADGGFAMTANAGLGRRLGWSGCSLWAFNYFLRSPKALCMHSRPEEVLDAIKSMQGAWLSLVGQCRNQMKDLDNICVKSENICSTVTCRMGKHCLKLRIKPMEGSLGSVPRVSGKRCINETWMTL